MDHRYYGLPFLSALEVFEALARHLSFKLAASELNLTAREIRQQIKVIEDELGVPLFVVIGADVALTAPVKDLYAKLASIFSKTCDVLTSIKRGGRSRMSMRSRRSG
ncbi:LysR family transcriptional regulator [Mesorhizobium sp.]|uniref:LysR family transcriptional regulator n=1 Tax=Mesorhizobium sp. TaxID=1871066 RepID=UPI000FE56501|nr:LysR family transcriptional regulator [Mesorhizobium sp.]RWI99635.1 MAG: LysR family transcriptional regulator [Mesorhizobium sp.]TIP88293.1 MAG: LysR family transcriptional regulator [Mesorhizobium sp.]